jgi:hypothetical protein
MVNKYRRAAEFWGERAAWQLGYMRAMLLLGRDDEAAHAATRARLAAIYAATAARVGGR